MDINTLHKLASEFEKLAQVAVSAQPGDVQSALERAKMWDLSKAVSPLLDAAGVPDSSAVHVSILVSAGPKVAFNVVLDPANPAISKKLNAMLAQRYAMPMANALKSANINAAGVLVVNWLKF